MVFILEPFEALRGFKKVSFFGPNWFAGFWLFEVVHFGVRPRCSDWFLVLLHFFAKKGRQLRIADVAVFELVVFSCRKRQQVVKV